MTTQVSCGELLVHRNPMWATRGNVCLVASFSANGNCTTCLWCVCASSGCGVCVCLCVCGCGVSLQVCGSGVFGVVRGRLCVFVLWCQCFHVQCGVGVHGVCVSLCYDTTQHNVVANNNSTHQEHRHHTAHENTKTSDDSHFLTENRNIRWTKGQKTLLILGLHHRTSLMWNGR